MRSWKFFTLIALFSLLLSACQPAAPAGPVTLRIAVLPILDALPMYVAQQEGFFTAHNVIVEFVPAGAAAERDQIILAGQADGMINDPISTLLYNKDSIQVQIVRFARTATTTFPQYRILASPQSGITRVDMLSGVPIGISEGTVIQYVNERLLTAEGLTSDQIVTIAVPNISERMQLLASGELEAAMMPDPLSNLAIQQGAVVVTDDTLHPEYAYSTYAFRQPVIEQYPAAIRSFLAAIDEAIALINNDPTAWDTLLTEQGLVPASLIGSYEIPAFPPASVPTQEQWGDALAWALATGLISTDVTYADSVTDDYLP
jgi:NitT/TauT family transport system substrate-binding protein